MNEFKDDLKDIAEKMNKNSEEIVAHTVKIDNIDKVITEFKEALQDLSRIISNQYKWDRVVTMVSIGGLIFVATAGGHLDTALKLLHIV